MTSSSEVRTADSADGRPTVPSDGPPTRLSDGRPTASPGARPADSSAAHPTDSSGTGPGDPSDARPSDPSGSRPSDPSGSRPSDSSGTRPSDSPRTGAALALRQAALGRPGVPVVDAVDLAVSPGEILTVVGASGCGKSTLLRTFAGLLSPLAGEVTQGGGPLTGPAADRALIFQEDALLPWRSLRANVELPLAIKGLPRAERRAQADSWLDRVGLAPLARQLPHRVSGGQRQRAQLARALAGAPRAVLMDEPFGALDAQTRAGMQDLLVEVWGGTGATVVFVTHDVDEALFLGDRVALLGAGRLTAVREVPRPRDRTAHDDPARTALRREVLTSLGT